MGNPFDDSYSFLMYVNLRAYNKTYVTEKVEKSILIFAKKMYLCNR